MSETQFKGQLKDKINSKSTVYPIARSLYRTYCNVAGPFHTLPNFIIFGVSRSGTTSLYQYLSYPELEYKIQVYTQIYFDTYLSLSILSDESQVFLVGLDLDSD